MLGCVTLAGCLCTVQACCACVLCWHAAPAVPACCREQLPQLVDTSQQIQLAVSCGDLRRPDMHPCCPLPAGVGSTAPSGEDQSTVSLVPVRAAEGHVLEAVCAGYDHTCGLDASGRAHCWGEQQLVGSAGHIIASCPALERRQRTRQRSCRCSNNASVSMQDAFP